LKTKHPYALDLRKSKGTWFESSMGSLRLQWTAGITMPGGAGLAHHVLWSVIASLTGLI